ncbi:MAG: AAA family ATPase [Polyangiaceae bacterium]|jgi:DNA repair exonuclease SbcCD ATPase subunit
MRIVSLAVTAWKGLEHAELADLAPDLNLIVGPNEAGKTRLVSALRYALFERYKGESEDKKALRSYGSTAPPSVEVRFETRGTLWTVRKQFLKQAYAKLEGGGRTWTDDDAESQLRDLLGTKPIQGRRDVDEFLGLWPLLWVRQGQSGVAPQAHMNDDARARLHDVLASQIDEVAAGPLGERIVARAEAERERYFTATGKETGELAQARARLTVAEGELAQAVAKRSEAHGAADELAAIRGELGGIDAKLAPQRGRVAEVGTRVARGKELAAKLRAQEADVGRHRAEMELAERAIKQREDLAEQLAKIERGIAEERGALDARIPAQGELAAREADASKRAETSNAALEAAHADHLRARRRERLHEAARLEHEVTARLARAKKSEARVVELRTQLAEARIDEAQIQRLRRASEGLAKTSAALAAASASLRLRAARDLVVDGQRLPEGDERAWTADAPLRVVIEGVGALEIRPGGTDLDARRVKEQDARHVLASELERAGVANLAEAEDRFARRTGLTAQLEHAEPLLAEAAPDGVSALEEEQRARATERAALGEPDAGGASIGDAEAKLAEATDGATRARGERDALRAELARGKEAIQRSEQAIAELERERTVAAARLAELPTQEALGTQLRGARSAWVDAGEVTKALAEELARIRESGAELGLEQETRILERLETERAEKHARGLALDAIVRVHGGQDLHERVQRAETERDALAETLRGIEARAAAARELVSALHAARREVQQRLVAPVIERARPYLESLLPGRRLRMDENWHVVGLGTGDVEEEFEALSGGAKEQVSILVRLALAEVLGEKESLPVVLDDCLVNTDKVRLSEMMRILYRASRKHQVIVFSCHDVDFERLGETRRFELARTTSAT